MAVIVLSGITVGDVDVAPSGADPYAASGAAISGAATVFTTGAFFAQALGASAKVLANGLWAGTLTSLFGAIFSAIGADTGPTIQDVLDKLDNITQQLDQIQSQLNQINANISALSQQVTAVSKQLANSTCNELQVGLDKYLSSIKSQQAIYASTVTTAQELPESTHPQGTVATLEGDFASLANHALGPDATTPNGGPLDSDITGIHDLLMGQAGNPDSGVIHACADAGLQNYRATADGTPPTAQQWVDDRQYYADVTNIVNYYEEYEVSALNLIQESTYYRITQVLRRDDVQVPVDAPTSGCSLKDPKSDDTKQLCRDIVTLTKKVYQNLVDEWTLTGRPYSDGKVVLQADAAATGTAGVLPILWVRNPSAVPAAMNKGTWKTDPNLTGSYDGFDGWQPAGLKEWQNLQNGMIAAYTQNGCSQGGSSVHTTQLFACMEAEGGFNFSSGFFWMPKQDATGLTLPAPSAGILSVLGYDMERTKYLYAGPKLALRCFVVADSTADPRATLVCGQQAFDLITKITKTQEEYAHGQAATYTVDWGFDVPGAGLPSKTFEYHLINPRAPKGDTGVDDYRYDQPTDSYPLWINTDATAPYPFFLQSIALHILEPCGTYTMCKVGVGTKTFKPDDTVEQLWPALDVPTTNTATQRCVNTIGVPQLCAPTNGAKPTAEDDQFERWLNDTIPNPSEPFPQAAAPPLIHQVGGKAQCLAQVWKAPPADWAYGQVRSLPTTWTATSGGTSYTAHSVSPLNEAKFNNQIDLQGLVSAGKFDPTQPFQLTCTVNARWARLANTGSFVSTRYQVTPSGTGYVITRVPNAPTIGAATAGDKSVTLHWTVGASRGGTISSFVVTPYLNGEAQPDITLRAEEGGDLSPAKGAEDSTVIKGLTPGEKYRFTVRAVVLANGTDVPVTSPRSSQSEAATPQRSHQPLKPVGPTTTTRPLTPVSPTTTTVPLTPVSPTTTTVPLSPVTTTTAPSNPAGFTQSFTQVSATEAKAVITPNSPVRLADLHYSVDGQQQDFSMTPGPNGSYEKTIYNLSPGDTLSYWFYFEPTTPGIPPITTQRFTYTQP